MRELNAGCLFAIVSILALFAGAYAGWGFSNIFKFSGLLIFSLYQ